MEVQRHEGRILIRCQGQVIAEHAELLERHQVRLLPDHGPGAIARNPRQPRPARTELPRTAWGDVSVEVRDLTLYERLAQLPGGAA